MALTRYISDPISCGSVSTESSSIFFFKSIMVDFAFWTYLIFSPYVFLDSRKSHRSSVILLVPRSSASYSDSSSWIQKSRITCIQQQGFLNKSSGSGSRHQHYIGLDQQYSCWNSSRIYLSTIVSNSWMVVWMEVYRVHWVKCLIIENSLCLWETSSYRSHFVFLDTSISYMLDLINLLGSYHRLPFMVLE